MDYQLLLHAYLVGVICAYAFWYLILKWLVGDDRHDHHLAIWLWPASLVYFLILLIAGNKGNDI